MASLPGGAAGGAAAVATPAEQKLAFLSSLDAEAALRYKVYASSRISNSVILHMLSEQTSTLDEDKKQSLATAIASCAKDFAVELAEAAKEVADRTGHVGPLDPAHLSEAYRLLAAQGKVLAVSTSSAATTQAGAGAGEGGGQG